jgi:mono/diheme cytochrome c family protein
MTRILKWALLIVIIVAPGGFLAFLYFIPPFFVSPPESFSGPVIAAAPATGSIADPAARAIAERGRAIVMRAGCIGCHATNGSQGPDLSRYLSGGGLKFETERGTFVSRNLTPDPETGLARRTDQEVKRVLRSGVLPDGHMVPYTVMPWAAFSNLTEQDLHAVVVYLRHLPAIRNRTPEPDQTPVTFEPGVIERAYGGKNYSIE